MDYSALIKDYLDDAGAHLNDFDGALLTLEKGGFNKELINTTLGSLHTLKGNSGMMGFESLKVYIHQIEEILKKASNNEIELNKAIGGLFNSANVIRDVLQQIGKEPSFNPDLTENILQIQRILEGTWNADERQVIDISSYLGARTDTIKVDFTRLDDLLNLVGELVIFKTRLNQIESHIKEFVSDKAVTKELGDGLELMGQTISGLQEGIMKARMLPVSHVFGKFPRMVRDLATLQKKEVILTSEGEDTEIDKTILDELGEPLLHLIRNAIDHGIESVEERVRSGKSRKGRITLTAAQESSNAVIKVMDDGRGINLEKIREIGIEKGMIPPDDVLDKESVASLIFSAGFTTKQEATDISGRGIGLDVVYKNITKLNGQVTVDSALGKGATFTIKLPLSLAIIQALMAEANGEVYAIPMSAVDESVKIKEEDVHIINNREVIRFRENVLPLIRLGEFFGLGRKRAKRFYVVIIGKAEKRIALAVDKLKGQQEIVIKPLDDTFGKSYGVAGASILGDGRIVLIVDIMAFWTGKEKIKVES